MLLIPNSFYFKDNTIVSFIEKNIFLIMHVISFCKKICRFHISKLNKNMQITHNSYHPNLIVKSLPI